MPESYIPSDPWNDHFNDDDDCNGDDGIIGDPWNNENFDWNSDGCDEFYNIITAIVMI